MELEKAVHLQSSVVPEQNPIARTKSAFENGKVSTNTYFLHIFLIYLICILFITDFHVQVWLVDSQMLAV